VQEVIDIISEDSVIEARSRIRHFINNVNLTFTALERMHILTAVSELGRNIFMYAQHGIIVCEMLAAPKPGLKLQFIDEGPGISDIEQAMKPKPVTKYHNGMGLGLMASKRLADDFDIETAPGKGTRITFIKWINT
jgi:serine/threonine-protein kinase RsbT